MTSYPTNSFGPNTVGKYSGVFLGINIPIQNSTSGGGINGYIAPSLVDVDKDYQDYEAIRFKLRDAWNTSYNAQLAKAKVGRVTTPFRAVNNAGDLLDRKYYSCGGPCQTFQSRPQLRGLRKDFGAIHSLCDNTNVPAAACNVRYVYDSSDYTTYLKQRSMTKTYNNITNGGNNSSGSQSALRQIKRY